MLWASTRLVREAQPTTRSIVEKQKDVGMSQLSHGRAFLAAPEMAEDFAS
jgi:hypothetical protein